MPNSIQKAIWSIPSAVSDLSFDAEQNNILQWIRNQTDMYIGCKIPLKAEFNVVFDKYNYYKVFSDSGIIDFI